MKRILFFALIFLLTACGPIAPGAEPTPPAVDGDLVSTQWQLHSFEVNNTQTPVVEGSLLTLIFQEGGLVGGTGGCNTFGGQYRQDNNQLQIHEIVSTLIACEDQRLNEQESQYFTALQSADNFTRTQDSLVINYADGQGALNFVPLAQ